MDVAGWLRALGLGQYEAVFRENDVGPAVLPELTADDLKELGIRSVGHRRALLAAVAELRPGPVRPTSIAAADAPASTAPPVEPAGAERRHLTVLFCDLAGSTALSARLDPEDLRAVISSYHAAVTDAVQGQGGYVAKLLGDGVLAYFGWPAANEDDAERAVRAGLAAVEAVARLAATGGERLAARAGIATGPVVVGEVLGEGEARERGVVGETPNLAARLQGLAEPGAVVLDDATRRLTGTLFECADLGAPEVKGLPGPVRAWRALGESGVESRFEALRSGAAAPMVGRAEELELLLRRWRRASAGEGQVVVVRGEAGIGKSRLTAALQEALAGEDREELMFYSSPQYADTPLRPVVARLERAAGLSEGDAPETRLAKLEALVLPLRPPPEDVALVADLLSVSTLGRWPVLDLSPQARRARLLQALVRRVRALAARRPVQAVMEDAHWVDPTTRELLDLLVAEAGSMALLLVVTHRPEFDAGAWIGQPHVGLVQLSRLGRAEHRALLQRVSAGKSLPAEVETEVLARTDGVPLFVEEVGRAVLESGVLREEADRWALDGPLPRLAVPGSLQASLVARLDRLSSAREVAQAGAVLGREFAHDLVASVSALPEAAVRASLDALAAADLVQRRGAPPEAVYSFRHALIRDAAEGTLLRERRRELHRRAAEAIEELRPGAAEREPEVLASHRAEAGQAERAIALYRRAGERSATRAAFREARAHLARGLALLPRVPDEATARRLEAGLQTALGHVAVADTGLGSTESGRAFGRAVDLCRGLGDEEHLAAALWGAWIHGLFVGDLAGALALAEECAGLARRQAAPDRRSRAFAALGMTHTLRGRPDLARPFLAEAAAGPDAYDPGAGALSGGSIAQAFLARVLAAQGALGQSAARAREALGRARAAGHPTSLANALAICCFAADIARDLGPLRDRAREMADMAGAHGYPYYAARARFFLGRVAAQEGRGADAVGLIAECLTAFQAWGTVLYTPHMEAALADALLLGGDVAGALAHTKKALAISARTGEAWFDAELHRCLGGLLLRRGEVARGEAELFGALGIARSQSARLFELRAARDLAGLRRGQDRLAEARDHLAPVYAAFTEGFDFPDLVEARALLDELGVTPAHSGERPPSARRGLAGPEASPAR